MTRTRWHVLQRVVKHIILVAGAVLFTLPFAFMLSTALKTPQAVFRVPPEWFPAPLVWANFPDALRAVPLLRYAGNTLFLAAANIIGLTVSSALVAYSFSHIHWPGRDILFMVLLGTLVLPRQVTMIPIYIVFSRLGWVGSYKPLIIPAFFAGPFAVFMLRQFFMTIPLELSEAAKLDGCSEWGIFWRIIVPLSKPALTTIAIFVFIAQWNDFMGPLIYLNDPDTFTLSLGLQMFQRQHSTEWTLLMAASVMAALPIIVLFFFAQRVFIQGIALTGIKG